MTRVRSTNLPQTSLLHERVAATDFLDCYCVPSSLPAKSVAEIALQFPGWVELLMQLRNLLVTPLGLATDVPISKQNIGPFPIESETENELIVGFDDKHLNFRISILSQDGLVYLATWVHPHNIGGHLYLAAVMPFHIVIVRDALKRVALDEQARGEE